MSKKVKTSYTLSRGRTDPFRRTIRYYKKDKDGKTVYDENKKPVELKESFQLYFEHDRCIELTDEEVELLQREIAAEIIVPVNLDAKGRQRDPSQIVPKLADAEATITKLEKRIEDHAAENAKLQEQLKQGVGDKKGDSKNDKASDAGTK